ncbi:hypothetical protein ABGB12_12770 [Actinocorallia sp. B10E7]|uniref:hypothetical protein n=1 Tax=Actinocorallia sp. B10E7 TaxID=3153558 RepID=UPI00325D2F89
MSSTRFNARTNSENRAPSGTSNSPNNARGNPESARDACRATVANNRSSASSRTVPTSRSNTVTPGSRTRLRHNHAVGPSACVHARL